LSCGFPLYKRKRVPGLLANLARSERRYTHKAERITAYEDVQNLFRQLLF
jgi:hypothetical protein